MDPMTRIFIRLVQWSRSPPSRSRLVIAAVTVTACLALALVERLVGWADWLRAEPVPVRHA